MKHSPSHKASLITSFALRKGHFMLMTPRCFPVGISSRENSFGTIYGEACMRRLRRTKTRITPSFPQVQAVRNILEGFKNGE